MIAVSSFKPFGIHEEIDRNQMFAYEFWKTVFSFIVYFNKPEEQISGANTAFIASAPFPTIQEMAEFCAQQSEWCCIVNADILVMPQFKAVERRLIEKEALCATSRRYQFDPEKGIGHSCTVVDMGMDIFCAVPELWKDIAKEIPAQFRIGHCLWDTWTLGFFEVKGRGNHYDFTPSKCIYHPIHGHREPTHHIDSKIRDKYLANANWPNRKITV